MITLITSGLFLLLQFFLGESTLSAQRVWVECQEVISPATLKPIAPDSIHLPYRISASRIEKSIEKAIAKNQADGYLNFSVDSFHTHNDTISLWIFRGKHYSDYQFHLSDSALQLLENSKLQRYIANNCIDWRQYGSFTQKFTEYYENNGHPFASATIIHTEQDGSVMAIDLQTGPHIRYDSIVLKGDASIRKGFLQAYLRFRRGKTYNEKFVKQIPRLLSELPFITLVRAPGVEFSSETATLYIFANKRKINQFDGYIGLVPVDENSGKVALSGELNLHLRNLFTIGESIELQWEATERFSQNLEIGADFPCLFRTPFGVNGTFALEKKDTTYINNQYKIGVQYAFSGNNYFRLYYARQHSNLLTSHNIADGEYEGFRKNCYGIEFKLRKLDYLYNPRKGFEMLIDLTFIQKNDESQTTSSQASIIAELTGYIPLHQRWSIVLGGKQGTLLGGDLITNELFRIGGIGTLQGFDDKSLYASNYTLGSAELRFIFTRNAYLNLFVNGGFIERRSATQKKQDFPIGFGIGTTLDTKAGQFYISYALGKLRDTSISFKTGKIHFGMLVNF